MIFRKPSFSENILAFLKRYNHVDVFADEEEKEKYKTERKFIDLCEEVNQKSQSSLPLLSLLRQERKKSMTE